MARRKQQEPKKLTVGREVSLEEFRETISFDLFKRSYLHLSATARARVDTFIKTLSK
jgi:hypothetical protein